MNLPNLTKSRHGTYYLRLQRNAGDFRFSLRTKNYNEASLLALVFNFELMKNPKLNKFDLATLIERARKLDIKLPNGMEFNNINTPEEMAMVERLVRNFDPIDNVGRLEKFPSEKLSAKPTTKLYEEVSEFYLTEVSLKNVASTVEDKRREYKRFIEIFGNLPIGQITDESAVSYKNRMIGEKNTIRQINKRISYNKEMFEYAIKNKYFFNANPFLNLNVGDKKTVEEETEHYENFTIEELQKIFNKGTYHSFFKKPDYVYGPFIALYSGARLEEICSLKLEQIKVEDGIVYLDIKKAKNKNSIRKIPLHKNILNSSFMDFVEAQRKKGVVMLFDHLTKGKNGYGKNLGRRFGEYLDLEKINIKSPAKVFHSFRHTVINNLTEKNVNPSLIMGLVGHYYQAKMDLSGVHFATYQHNKKLSAMKEIVDMIDYGIEFTIE